MKYKKLIFDLDGTLVSDRESMKYAFCCVLKELGITPSKNLALEWLKFDDAYWHEIESGRTVFPEYYAIYENSHNRNTCRKQGFHKRLLL